MLTRNQAKKIYVKMLKQANPQIGKAEAQETMNRVIDTVWRKRLGK